jgi:AraC-like DNA-binding protein
MLSHPSCNDRVAPDALSEVLQDLRLVGASYCRSEFNAPWGLEFPPDEGAVFHFVAEGSCWLKTSSGETLRLESGDVVLLPHGAGHSLRDQLNSPTKRIHEVIDREQVGETTYRMRVGGTGTRSLLVCCAVGFEEASVHPLLELMPEVLHVRGGGSDDPSLLPLLEAMALEIGNQRVGAATVMTRLADIVITRVVRGWADSRTEDTTGWLAAIRDPQIGKALAAFHRRPSQAWSVVSLAAAANLSRSIFSERFAAVLGTPPAAYVARWRMHLAGTWLRAKRLTVSEVATRLGYESEASFSRAFKRFMGASPSTFRQRHTGTRVEAVGTKTRAPNVAHASSVTRTVRLKRRGHTPDESANRGQQRR